MEDGVIGLGSNRLTMLKVRRALKGFIADFPEYERLLPHVKGKPLFLKLWMLELRTKLT